jgi:hypothetical protein
VDGALKTGGTQSTGEASRAISNTALASTSPPRLKDWRNPEYRGSFSRNFQYGVGVHVAALADKDPVAVRDALLKWLDDPTPLGHKIWPEATVGDLAAGCLFWLRPGDFGELCERLLLHPASNAVEILRTFLSVNSADIAVEIPAWLSNAKLSLLALKLFYGVPTAAIRQDAMQRSLQEALPTILVSTMPMQRRLDAARIAVAANVCVSEAWGVVAAAYRQRFPVGATSSWWITVRRLLTRARLHTNVFADDLGWFMPYRRQDVFDLLRAELEASMTQAASWDIGGRMVGC